MVLFSASESAAKVFAALGKDAVIPQGISETPTTIRSSTEEEETNFWVDFDAMKSAFEEKMNGNKRKQGGNRGGRGRGGKRQRN